MGKDTGFHAANAVLRFFELCSAAVVVGVIGWAMHRVDGANGPPNGRLIYAEVVAALSIIVSLALVPPREYVFKAWPLDLVFFVLWVAAFGVLANLTGAHACTSTWFDGYWRRVYMTPSSAASLSSCRNWRAVLAFSGISWILFLISTLIGIYKFTTRNQYDGHSTSHHYFNPWQRQKRPSTTPKDQTASSTTTTQMQDV